MEQNGTKDMMGNVWEWNEAIPYISGDNADRGLRGGSFHSSAGNLWASIRYTFLPPTNEGYDFGFRLSEVPEPSAIIVLLGGLAGLLGIRRRRER